MSVESPTVAMSELQRLPLDLTAALPSHRKVVTIYHSTIDDGHVIVPPNTPFYTDTLVIQLVDSKKGLVKLTPGIDYRPIQLDEELTIKANREVCLAVVMTNKNEYSEYKFTYQETGGPVKALLLAVIEEYRALKVDVSDIKWGDIVEKPTRFVPTHHPHGAGDIYGMDEVVKAIKELSNSIVARDTDSISDLMKLIDAKQNIKGDIYRPNTSWMLTKETDTICIRIPKTRTVSEYVTVDMLLIGPSGPSKVSISYLENGSSLPLNSEVTIVGGPSRPFAVWITDPVGTDFININLVEPRDGRTGIVVPFPPTVVLIDQVFYSGLTIGTKFSTTWATEMDDTTVSTGYKVVANVSQATMLGNHINVSNIDGLEDLFVGDASVWSPEKVYADRDIVSYRGEIFILTTSTAQGTPPNISGSWLHESHEFFDSAAIPHNKITMGVTEITKLTTELVNESMGSLSLSNAKLTNAFPTVAMDNPIGMTDVWHEPNYRKGEVVLLNSTDADDVTTYLKYTVPDNVHVTGLHGIETSGVTGSIKPWHHSDKVNDIWKVGDEAYHLGTIWRLAVAYDPYDLTVTTPPNTNPGGTIDWGRVRLTASNANTYVAEPPNMQHLVGDANLLAPVSGKIRNFYGVSWPDRPNNDMNDYWLCLTDTEGSLPYKNPSDWAPVNTDFNQPWGYKPLRLLPVGETVLGGQDNVGQGNPHERYYYASRVYDWSGVHWSGRPVETDVNNLWRAKRTAEKTNPWDNPFDWEEVVIGGTPKGEWVYHDEMRDRSGKKIAETRTFYEGVIYNFWGLDSGITYPGSERCHLWIPKYDTDTKPSISNDAWVPLHLAALSPTKVALGLQEPGEIHGQWVETPDLPTLRPVQYVKSDTVEHNGRRWVAVADDVGEEIPGTGGKWEMITTADSPYEELVSSGQVIDVVHELKLVHALQKAINLKRT